MKRTIFLLVFILTAFPIFSQHIIFIGPMLHINFGGEKAKLSYAVEASYWTWNAKQLPLLGADIGFEWEKGKKRLYAEGQTGIALAGVSAGPFLEFSPSESTKPGFQMSVWGNYYLGFDLRYRIQKGQNVFAPGVYAKAPIYSGPDDGDGDSDNDFDWD